VLMSRSDTFSKTLDVKGLPFLRDPAWSSDCSFPSSIWFSSFLSSLFFGFVPSCSKNIDLSKITYLKIKTSGLKSRCTAQKIKERKNES